MDHLPSRWDRPPAAPVIFQNNAPPVNVHVSISPRFANHNVVQNSTAAILGAFVLGMAAVLLFAEDPSKRPK